MANNPKASENPSTYASAPSSATPSISTNGYSYRPLHSDRKEIRVLRFDKGGFLPKFCRLRLKVQTLSLSDAVREKYYCISYAWGENPGLAPVILDGHEAQIPDSAEEALRGVLHHIGKDSRLQATLVWIDAVCINQDDLKEKSHQVAFMGNVFAQANLVFAWLGPDDGTMQATIQSFEALQQQCQDLTDEERNLDFLEDLPMSKKLTYPCLLVELPSDSSTPAVSSFLHCRYFTRLWILQEIAVASRVVLIRGEEHLPWPLCEEAIRWISVHAREGVGNHDFQRVRSMIDFRIRAQHGGYGYHLFDQALTYSWLFKTSNAWDMVYAVLDISARQISPSQGSSIAKIVPNYEKPLRYVYQEASWIAMRLANSLDLLNGPAIFAPVLGVTPDWPSWVPRFHEMSFDDPQHIRHLNRNVSYGLHPDFRLDEKNADVLQVEGLIVGAVAGLLPLDTCSVEELSEWVTQVWPEEIDEITLKGTAVALVSGLYEDSNADESESILSDFVAFMLEGLDDCAVGTRLVLEQITAAMALGVGDAAQFHREIVGQGTLFQTEDGRLGNAVAKLSAGDHICILFGCKDPFVLRKVEDKWKIQAHAYVPGIAKGEYVQQLQADGRLGEETVTFGIC